MEKFFKPRGIALIGATANQLKGGYAILFNLKQGYTGKIYPVNPRYDQIDGLQCYGSVRDVPDPVDLAIVFIPAERVPAVITDCAERGIGHVMIQSAGFAESGQTGRRLQAELLNTARDREIRIWGPNCMGLVDAHRQFVFSFASSAIWDEGLSAGPVSLVVQSGLLSAGFLIDHMTHGTMGISKACSIGNKSDVDECDILDFLLEDPQTKAIALYLESINDGRRFITLCQRSQKPIVVLKGGQSKGGAAAAMSHTASLAGDGAVASGVLAQAGVIQAQDFGQMMDMARTLAFYPQVQYAQPPAVAVMTYSGAAGIVSADFIERHGLALAQLSNGTVASLKSLFPEWMPVGNPVDLWPAIEANGPQRVFPEALKALSADPQVDLIVLHVFVGGRIAGADIRTLARIARKAGKPLFCWVLGARDQVRSFTLDAQAQGVPVYREIGRSIECLATLKKQPARVRRAPAVAEPVQFLTVENRQLLETGGGVLDEYKARRILAAAGIPVVAEAVATNEDEALTAAGQIGYPVVLKALLTGLVHKTEAGLIQSGIFSDAQLKEALVRMSAKVPDTGRFLVQRQLAGEIEIIAGFIRDRQFGPCVMCGLGGIFAEALADRTFALAPLTREEALAAIQRLKSRQLLEGWRGQAPVDKPALADILVNLARLGCTNARIQEVDLNPLIITAGRPVAVDATIILTRE